MILRKRFTVRNSRPLGNPSIVAGSAGSPDGGVENSNQGLESKPPSRGRHAISEDKVGYGRPPKQYQFKPGQSGNPSGGQKAPKSESGILQEILKRKVTIRERNSTRKIPLLEAVLLKIAEEALRGDLKATVFLLNRLAALQSAEPATFELSPDETEVFKAYAERLREQMKGEE